MLRFRKAWVGAGVGDADAPGIGKGKDGVVEFDERDVKPWGRADVRREKVISPVDRERWSSWRPTVYPER